MSLIGEAAANPRSVLAGVRVLDLSMVLAGPFCTQLLGDLGADVIKVEPPSGDPTRKFGPYFYNGESAYFLSTNRNKRSLVLDLKAPEGIRAFIDLAANSDVIFDSFRPGVMERLGIGYARLSQVNPRLVSCSVTGFGTYGPLAHRPAFDIVVQAMGGGMALTGFPDRGPALMGLPVGDCLAGMFAAHGILAALLERSQTDRGRRVEVSMLNSQIALLSCYASYYFASGKVPGPFGLRHPQNVPARVFLAKDAYFVVYAALDAFFRPLCAAIGFPDLADDPRFRDAEGRRSHREELERQLEAVFKTRTAAEWEEELTSRDVPVGVVYDMAQILNHPHVLAQEMVVELSHPVAGRFRATGNPVKIAGTPAPLEPPPLLGQHTREILATVAGYEAARIDELAAKGVVRSVPTLVGAVHPNG